jgi:Family of unknown function (DUF5995)
MLIPTTPGRLDRVLVRITTTRPTSASRVLRGPLLATLLAIAAVALTGALPDFDAVNALLNETAGPMIDEQARRFDPSVKAFTAPVLGISSLDLGALLGIWRTEAYHNAERLIAAPTPAARRKVAASIVADAAQRARLIQVATSYAVLGGSTAARDRFCARQTG